MRQRAFRVFPRLSTSYRAVAAWAPKAEFVVVKVAVAVLGFAQVVDGRNVAAVHLHFHHLTCIFVEHGTTRSGDGGDADRAATRSADHLFDAVEEGVAATGQAGGGVAVRGAAVARPDRQRRRRRRRRFLVGALPRVHVLLSDARASSRQRTGRARLMMKVTITLVHMRLDLNRDRRSQTRCHFSLLFESAAAAIDGASQADAVPGWLVEATTQAPSSDSLLPRTHESTAVCLE